MYLRRKVYSMVEPEEQLYSVNMTEEEYDLFSAFCDGYYETLYSDDDDYSVAKGALIGAGLVGGAAGLGYGASKLEGYKYKSRSEAYDKAHKDYAKAVKEMDAKAAEEAMNARNKAGKAGKVEKYSGKTAAGLKKAAAWVGEHPAQWAEKGAAKLEGKNWASKKAKAALEAIGRNKVATGATIAALGAAGLGAGAGYGYKKYKENRD